MTVFYKPTYHGGHGKRQGQDPRRVMTKADLGIAEEQQGEWDPDLLAVGIKAPRITHKQKLLMQLSGARAAGATNEKLINAKREQMRDLGHFNRTVEGKIVRQEVQDILAKLRWLGQVRKSKP